MNVLFIPEAQQELLAVVSRYEMLVPGLGDRFWSELQQTISRIAASPNLYEVRSSGYRRANMRIFPYYLPFIERISVIWILAVGHQNQEPEYWSARKRL